MRKLIMISALAAAAVAEEGFVPAQPIHIEPLAGVEVAPGAVFADTVILELTLDAEGRVEDAEIWSSSGNEAMDAAALASALKCLFEPATQDGEPIESYHQIYYRLSAYRTREYVSAEEKAGTAEKAPTPKEGDGGRD